MTQFLGELSGEIKARIQKIAIVTLYCIAGISVWTAFGQSLERAFRSKRFTDVAFPIAGSILVLIGLAAGLRGP